MVAITIQSFDHKVNKLLQALPEDVDANIEGHLSSRQSDVLRRRLMIRGGLALISLSIILFIVGAGVLGVFQFGLMEVAGSSMGRLVKDNFLLLVFALLVFFPSAVPVVNLYRDLSTTVQAITGTATQKSVSHGVGEEGEVFVVWVCIVNEKNERQCWKWETPPPSIWSTRSTLQNVLVIGQKYTVFYLPESRIMLSALSLMDA
jgi:hypothetical protein